jgi:putative transposase
MAMLEGEQALTLDVLNEATQAWVEQEYHRTVHTELRVTPLARYLAGPSVARPCPDSVVLRDALRIEVKRRARRADGTSAWVARASRSRRAAPPQRGAPSLRPLGLEPRRSRRSPHRRHPVPDQAAGQVRQRRRAAPPAEPRGSDLSPLPPTGMAPLLAQLLADYAATGLPPAYLPRRTRLIRANRQGPA